MAVINCMSAIFGGIIGDIVGVPYEFRSRNEMLANPCTDMVGYGTYNKPSGTWSDDSSMVLATMDSIVDKTFNLDKMMLNFIEWQVNGKYTQDGFMFSIGDTTIKALESYKNSLNYKICGQKRENNNGNGSLMRIMPVAIYLFAKYGVDALDNNDNVKLVEDISGLTHAHEISKSACIIYVTVALHLLNGEGKEGILIGLEKSKKLVSHKCFKRLFDRDFFKTDTSELSGSGYVVNTIESSLHIAYNSNNYKDCVLTAVNLGYDTDTTASVTGGLAGIMYGIEGIDKAWLNGVRKKEYVADMCNKFLNNIL